MAEAIRHPGFAVIDILQPCVSFNRLNTYQWYRERISYQWHREPIKNMTEYSGSNLEQALNIAGLWGDVIPVGLFYRVVKPSFSDSLPQLSHGSLISQLVGDRDIARLMEELS